MSAQSGRRLHQRGAQGTSMHVTENAVQITEKLKRESRDTYSMNANILGPTACAMAMQSTLVNNGTSQRGMGTPHMGAGFYCLHYRRTSRKLWARHLSRCSCSMAKVSAIHVHLTIFNLLTNRRSTWGMLQHWQCRRWRDTQAKHLLRNAGNWYLLDWINHVSGQRARLSWASTRRSSGRKIGANAEHCNRPKQNPCCGRTIPGMWCSRRERMASQGLLTKTQCARLVWHSITRQQKCS